MRVNLNNILVGVYLALALTIAACGPRGVTDQALATDIQAKLYADQGARTANVKVAVANGVVTLTGDAPNADVALEVVNIANGTSGVKSVDNQLKLSAQNAAAGDTPATTAPAPAAPAYPSSSPAKPSSSALAQNQPPPPMPMTPAPAALAPPPPLAQNAPPPEPMRHEEPPPPPKPVTLTIPSGTEVGVTMIDSISSKTNTQGQTFRASITSPIVVDGRTAIPSGAGATVLLATAKGAGRIKGSSELEVRLVSIQTGGRSYEVDSTVHDEVGKGRGKQSAIRSGIGAAAGALIGGLAGGGKGAGIGALAGGGAGAGYQLATHGQQVTIPSESTLTFSIQAPIVVTLHGRHESRDDSESNPDRQ